MLGMKNLPSDSKGQPGSPEQLLHLGVLGQMTSVEFQLLAHTEEQPCQAFPRNNREKIIQFSCIKMVTVKPISNKSLGGDLTISRIRG